MQSIIDTFFQHAQHYPTKTAITCDEHSISYAELAHLVKNWAAAMQAQGVQPEEHIAVILPNNIEYIALMVVAAYCGFVLVPLNISLPTHAIVRAFQATKVKHVVATTDIITALHQTPYSLKQGLWIALDETCDNALLLADLLKQTKFNQIRPAHITHETASTPFILTMTSGSTGDPKPIVLTQQTKLQRAQAAIALYNVSANDTILIGTPLYHSLAERLALIGLITGGTLVVMSRFSVTEWLRIVAEQQVTFTIAVSSQLQQIAGYLTIDQPVPSLKALRCLVSSSALLDKQTKHILFSHFTGEFHECYGTSEIAIATNLNAAQAQRKLQSVGIALPDVDIKILKDDDTFAAVEETGEIICKTPMLFNGYYAQPELTHAAMFNGYFCTGDIGKLDKEGFLYFLGRKKEIIITGGINVYPTDIETVVSEYDSVQESAAFALPDAKLGEVVAVALVPQDAEQFNLRKLRLHCATRLADYQQPRKFFIVNALPKNSLGKVMKHSLLKQLTSKVPDE